MNDNLTTLRLRNRALHCYIESSIILYYVATYTFHLLYFEASS